MPCASAVPPAANGRTGTPVTGGTTAPPERRGQEKAARPGCRPGRGNDDGSGRQKVRTSEGQLLPVLDLVGRELLGDDRGAVHRAGQPLAAALVRAEAQGPG